MDNMRTFDWHWIDKCTFESMTTVYIQGYPMEIMQTCNMPAIAWVKTGKSGDQMDVVCQDHLKTLIHHESGIILRQMKDAKNGIH